MVIGNKTLWQLAMDKLELVCEKVYIIGDKDFIPMCTGAICRPPYLGDRSEDVLEWFRDCFVKENEPILLIQATNPMVTSEQMDDAIRIYETSDIKALVSINPYTCKPDGSIYISDSSQLFQKDMWVIHWGGVLNPLACDIDTYTDYCIANAIYNERIINAGL